MGLDIRLPLGMLFSLTGLLMTGYGLATRGSEIYEKSLGTNVNLDWGVILLAFGIVMFLLGRKKPSAEELTAAKSTPPRTGHGH